MTKCSQVSFRKGLLLKDSFSCTQTFEIISFYKRKLNVKCEQDLLFHSKSLALALREEERGPGNEFGDVPELKILFDVTDLWFVQSILSNPRAKCSRQITSHLFNFIWNNKPDRIKRELMYSDYAEGGLRVPNIDIKLKSLKLAWIARLISNQPGLEPWRVIPDHYFSKYGGLIFLLRCNYDEKCLDQSSMPSFYKQILLFFKDLRVLLNQDTGQDMILFNNKEILIDGKTVCYNKWLVRNVIAVHDLLDQSTGKFLSYHEFKQYYNLNCNFLTFFQVISAIPKHLLEKAKSSKHLDKGNLDRNNVIFHLSPSMSLNLLKMQSRDHYWLLNRGDTKATGLIKWEKELQLVDFKWEKYFNSIKTLCNETKLRDFYYKLLHRIVTTKR